MVDTPSKNGSAVKKAPIETDRTLFYTQLAYMPKGFKERRIWMAQMIYYAKLNAEVLVSPQLASKFRALQRSEINSQVYKEIIDPKIPGTEVGGTAEFFSADFKAFPIDVHLDNIIEASIEQIPDGLNCSVVDPVAKALEQKDKERIAYQVRVREIINSFLKESGMKVPPVGKSENPYKWIERFTSTDSKKMIDTIGSSIEQIQNQIKDDRGLRLFMKYLYKNGLEIAFEEAIRYYVIDQNKWEVNSEMFLKDLKNFNCYSGRWYTDLTTGRGVVEYLDPSKVYTSPFSQRDGEDIVYFFYEKAVTFAEFERMLGAELPEADKKAIFNYYKQYSAGGRLGYDYYSDMMAKPDGYFAIGNSKITIGFFSCLTQESEDFAESFYNDVEYVEPRTEVSWDATENHKTKKVNNKTYNVWYSCYYMPVVTANAYNYNDAGGAISWDWLSSRIYRIEKNVDMYRYGPDLRYAKSQLVCWRDNSRPSFAEIKERFMPKIHTMWHKLQNCIVNDLQALVADYDLIGGLLNAVDEGQKDINPKTNQNAFLQQIRTLKQSGQAWLKFRDKNGQKMEFDPSKLFVLYDNKMLEKAERYLMLILTLYDLMTRALAMSGPGEGMTPKPRTPLGGVQMALEGTNNNIYYITKAFKWCLLMFSERCVQWVKCICTEKKELHYEERYKELQDVLGFASTATLEGVEDIPLSNIGLTVHNEDMTELKAMVNQIASQMVAQREISPAVLELILSTRNWKLALFELEMEKELADERLQKARQQEFEQAMALKEKDLQIAQALVGAKAQGVNSNIQTQGMVDQQLQAQMGGIKLQSQLEQNEQRNQFKQGENAQKTDLDKDKKAFENSLEQQNAMA